MQDWFVALTADDFLDEYSDKFLRLVLYLTVFDAWTSAAARRRPLDPQAIEHPCQPDRCQLVPRSPSLIGDQEAIFRLH